MEETICFLSIPFCEFYSVSFVVPAIDMILTKLNKRYILDQAPLKYSFMNLGISMSCEFWKRASYLHII